LVTAAVRVPSREWDGAFDRRLAGLSGRGRGVLVRRASASAGSPGGGGDGSVVCLGDAFDDCQAEADTDTCVVGAYAFGAAKKRLGKRGYYLWGELLAGVLDGERHALGVNVGRDPHGAVFGQVVDDRVLHEVRGHLQQERV